MSASGHSKFSASSAHRLLACPGSYDLGQRCDDGTRRSTIFSAEGTLAHSVSEAALFSGVDTASILGKTFSADGFDFSPDEEFIEGVNVYVDFINTLQALGYLIALEIQVEPSIHWRLGIEEDLGIHLFGTADCIAYHPIENKLLIVDLKFGKGVSVEIENNPQFLYYGAGSFSQPLIDFLRRNHGLGPAPSMPDNLETIVVQPRAFHPDGPIRKATYTKDQVIDWTRNVLHPGVKKAVNDKGQTLHAGEHCRFCPALAHCPEQLKLADAQVVEAFKNAPAANVPSSTPGFDPLFPGDDPQAQALAALPDAHLSDEVLGEMLDKVAVIRPYIAALEALAEARLKQARPVKGWRIAPTRTRRVWNDTEENVIDALKNMGVAEADVVESVLLSPAQTEKKLGKKKFAALLQQIQLVKQSAPGTTLVPEGDPRARASSYTRTTKEAFNIKTIT